MESNKEKEITGKYELMLLNVSKNATFCDQNGRKPSCLYVIFWFTSWGCAMEQSGIFKGGFGALLQRRMFWGILFLLGITCPVSTLAYINNQVPDMVLGGLTQPRAVCSDGQRLFVADSGTNRVLIYNSFPKTSATTPDVALSGFSSPSVYSDGLRMFVADQLNNRVLIYNSIPTSNTTSADVILGGLSWPRSVCSDGTRMYVSDSNRSRILIYNSIPTSNSATPNVILATGSDEPCDLSSDGVKLFAVLRGVSEYVVIYNSIPTSNSVLPDVTIAGFSPYGVYSDGKQLFIADGGNSRVLIWNTVPTASGIPPDVVFTGLGPTNISGDGSRLCISESGNNRVLVYYPFPYSPTFFPNYGVAGKVVKVSSFGLNNSPLRLTKNNDSDIIGTSTNFSETFFTYTLDLTNSNPGVYGLTMTASTNPRVLSNAFTVLSPIAQPVKWTLTDLGDTGGSVSTSYACSLNIGDADQDGQQELYISNGDVAPFQLKKYSGGWGVPSTLPAPISGFTRNVLLDGNCDGNWELYSTSLSNHVIQFKGPAWSSLDLGLESTGATRINAMTTADVDRDGKPEFYTGGNVINGAVCQIKNTGTAWARSTIAGYVGSGQTLSLATGDAQNSGFLAVYAGSTDQKVYQYKLINKTWQVSLVGTGLGMMNGVAVGDGDNDNQQEIYAACQDGKVYRFYWNGSWVSQVVGNLNGGAMYAVAVSDADNDGLNELYAACQDGHAYMFKKNNTSWVTLDLGSTGTPLYALSVGDADNDYQFEVYALGQNGRIYQLKAAPGPTPTPTATAVLPIADSDKRLKILNSKINPLKGEVARIRWYQPGDGGTTLVVYNMVGDKIATLADNVMFTAHQLNEITWDGKTTNGAVVGSGIYIVYLQTGDYKTYSKVAVVK